MAKSSKGSAWEREICKILSKWINGTIKPYVFWRGHGSGAMFSMDHDVGDTFSGDIYAIRDEGKFFTSIFSIELKNGYPSVSIDKHLKCNKSDELREFWIQSCRDAVQSNKEPLLIYKKKGLPTPWICFPENAYQKIKHLLPTYRFIHLNWPEYDLPDMYIFDLKELIIDEGLTPDNFKEAFNIN